MISYVPSLGCEIGSFIGYRWFWGNLHYRVTMVLEQSIPKGNDGFEAISQRATKVSEQSDVV